MNGIPSEVVQRIARREFLHQSGLGLGSVALTALMAQDGLLMPNTAHSATTLNPLAQKPPHFPAKAKSVIQLFMAGGPSQLELFDYKPELQRFNGQPIPKSLIEGKRFAFVKENPQCLGTSRKFARHGQCGAEISELLPHTARIVDDIAIIRTMQTENFNHGPAKLLTQTGTALFGRPSIGSWVLYGLGSESDNLPGFVVLTSGPRGPRGGSYLWSSGFLSSVYQGVPLRSKGDPILNLSNPTGIKSDQQRRVIDTVKDLNQTRLDATGDPEIAARIASYEMAYRMQSSTPDLIDLSEETDETLALYGAKAGEASFANNCLLARRLIERGVRFVTLFHTDWDHHGSKGTDLGAGLERTCKEVDQPCAALVKDLKRRGLLDDTLVVWGGEFGRTPFSEPRELIGRDHHIDAYSVWLAGGGVQGGQVIGQTDDLGFYAADPSQSLTIHDLQATILHCLGLDHLRLTFRFQGRDFRLTDVAGKVVNSLLL
jgi:hypothetical protein